jgi:hypothetical protein
MPDFLAQQQFTVPGRDEYTIERRDRGDGYAQNSITTTTNSIEQSSRT